MRLLTYVLGAIAGFFTFEGIGLIYKGFQVEGGITNPEIKKLKEFF